MSATRILAVDDEESLLLTLGANLELEGFEVTGAKDGPEALARLAERDFDIVLSDFRMPGMNGLELYREIRRRKPDLPVILMTAFALESLVQEALREGAFGVVSKPFSMDGLIAAVAAAARRPIVLLLDDAESLARSLAEALSACGVPARPVFDGPSALEAIGQGNIDVCVVDMVMPGMDGPAVIERIRALDPRILFIGFSGYDLPEVVRKVSSRLATFLRKPVDPGTLMEAIGKARVRMG